MKKSVKKASIEEILHDVCHYEDPDTSLIVNTTEEGGVFVSDPEWNCAVTSDSMKEALIKFQIKSWEELGYSKLDAIENSKDYHKLDWRPAISRMRTK